MIEQYLAEEAIGLASSLRWDVIRGPFWQKEKEITDVEKIGKLPPNTVYMEPQYGNEIKDGTYIKSSLGNGVYYVKIKPYRKMESFSIRNPQRPTEISTNNGRISK